MSTETEENAGAPVDDAEAACAGAVVVFAAGRPQCRVIPMPHDSVEIGRDELATAGVPDARVSARHVRVTREGRRFCVEDLESKNGSFVDGRPVRAARPAAGVLRIGRTVMLLVHDVRPFAPPGVETVGGFVVGPVLRAAHQRAAAIARSGANLLMMGESGSGKEICASVYHQATGSGRRPLVALNCATIPRELAERTLFGARRGAYTGAVADADGLVQTADGGTLFLDEIAELDLIVQAKLLRALETRQVTPVGGVKPIAVDVRLCAATHKDLRDEVAAGRFREDLYFRIGRPDLRVPPLRDRREEIPFLIDRALSTLPDPRPAASAELVEATMLRAWPGNVRELLADVTSAAVVAATARRDLVTAADLPERAGGAIRDPGPGEDPPDHDDGRSPVPRAAIEEALRAERGNVVRAAARLGLSRARLRRLIERARIDVEALRD